MITENMSPYLNIIFRSINPLLDIDNWNKIETNGAITWDEIESYIQWCKDNLGPRGGTSGWSIVLTHVTIFYFRNAQDAVAFKLAHK